MSPNSLSSKILRSGGMLMFLLLAILLALLLGGGCDPGHTLFSNDAPLGRLMSACHRLPARFAGCWQDLNSIGYRELAAVPSISYGLEWLLGPLWFSRFYVPLALLLLGLAVAGSLHHFGLSKPACIVAGFAAVLNSGFFSTASWGIGGHVNAVAMGFLALAALADPLPKQQWLRALLGGLALGMAVTEGADVGAIISMLVAGYVMWQACVTEGPRAKRIAVAAVKVALAALCAGALAADAISELMRADVLGVVDATQHGGQTKQGHWDWVTQWSLPKVETLGLVVPGLFGYRIDAPEGASYWGNTGQDAAWERYLASDRKAPPPSGFLRFVGGGNYVGVAVVLVAAWAAAQSFRRKNSVFEPGQRKLLWFWAAAAVIALLLAFGRYAPFYRLIYPIPPFSKIRNPVKFIHVLSFALIVLLAFGIDGLWRKYLRPAGLLPSYRWPGFFNWWRKAVPFDRRWLLGCVVVLGLSLVGWCFYAQSQEPLENYLRSAEFDPKSAQAIAAFSIRQVGWFVLFFALASGVLGLILSGAFAGKRAVLGATLLGTLLVVDLWRTDHGQPPKWLSESVAAVIGVDPWGTESGWVTVWDYTQKYTSNPIVDLLRDRPYEHRVADMPREYLEPEFQKAFGKPNPAANDDYLLYQVYSREWAQHLFCYHNVQSLDIVQLPRKPQDLRAWESALTPDTNAVDSPLFLRRWQLSNTRYALGSVGFLNYVNHKLAPERQPFRLVERFSFVPRPGFKPSEHPMTTADVIATLTPQGKYALLEYTNALPRAKLYCRWQVTTNDPAALSRLRPGLGDTLTQLGASPTDQAALSRLADPDFDPAQCVLVAGDPPAALPASGTNTDAGTVEFASYAPRDIVLKAQAPAPSVLLLNDRFDPHWNVRVDGKPAQLLRCNVVMRGVFLPPGAHHVEFRFQSPIAMLYVSLAAWGVGILALGVISVSGFRNWANLPPAEAESRPPGPRGQPARNEPAPRGAQGNGNDQGAGKDRRDKRQNRGRPAGKA